MDSARGRYQHSVRAYKSTSPGNYYHENNYYNSPANHGIFRSRVQRHTLKWRKDYYHRGNYRSRLPYRKNDINNKKSSKTAEDEEEEERKKKLNDTAKKLLNKLKTWNAEKSCSEDNTQQNYNKKEVVSESSSKHNEEKNNSDGKPRRIAHSKKAKLLKNRTRKSFTQPAKTVTRYDVNKETVKDFQNRIQHKLIEDIMLMPKENLQNVLNDPKINPIMEKKMSRLVRENKPLIAQKLRALAESKMKSSDYSTNSQLLDDIDKLIDPVIETDLSVLPFELIKQMESIFQVQFDYSQNNTALQIENEGCESAINDADVEINNLEQDVKVKNSEDLSIYECSTDEDEEISPKESVELDLESNSLLQMHDLAKKLEVKEQIALNYSESPNGNNIESDYSPLEVSVNTEKKLSQRNEDTVLAADHVPFKDLITCLEGSKNSPKEPSSNSLSSLEVASSSCQTCNNNEDASTQTETTTEVGETLYGVPLPKKATEESISALLNEVNSIQILANKLNERRLMIFLQLAKMNPSGSFINDDVTKSNFIESVSYGNLCLIESLKQFFSIHLKENHKSSECKSSESEQKSADLWKNKDLRNIEDKRSSRH